MKWMLMLSMTGRFGSAVISHLPSRVKTIAGLRTEASRSRLPGDAYITGTALVDLASTTSLQRAMRDLGIAMNATRFREDILATTLVDPHRLTLGAAPGAHPPLVVTVGGAGSLHPSGQRRFWQSPAFPTRILPRGHARAKLYGHLGAGYADRHWAYLIPPPAFIPEGQAAGSYRAWQSSGDESGLVRHIIDYIDFASVVADVAGRGRTGIRLVET